jgi:DNA-binding transcriptional MocR family regulator
MNLRSSSTTQKKQMKGDVPEDPDIRRLAALKKEFNLATQQDAQWAMMYFLEDNTHTIRQLLVRLNAKYKHRRMFTFPGISEVQEEDDL